MLTGKVAEADLLAHLSSGEHSGPWAYCLFFPENILWHFLGDNLHEMSNLFLRNILLICVSILLTSLLAKDYTVYIMLRMLGKNFSRRHFEITFFSFFLDNRL